MQQIVTTVLQRIQILSDLGNQPILIAIDGRCASGKTTLAAMLQQICGCNVIHMDHFFLRPEQRTAERMRYPGSNVDYERFQSEVMIPLQQNREFSYCPYNCRMQKLDAPVCVQQNKICIIEGAYSCRPELIENYALKIFLTTAKEEQLCRIERRNGKESVQAFVEKWIPMEENYIEAFEIEKRCDFIFET